MLSHTYHWIINPKAAGGTALKSFTKLKPLIEKLFSTNQFHFTQHKGHATDIASQLSQGSCQHLIAVGGDGTLNEVISGLFKSRQNLSPSFTLGTLPLGTGSDFIKALKLPRDPKKALKVLAQNHTVSVDVGQLQIQNLKHQSFEHYFINSASCGLSAEVAYQVNQSTKWAGPLFTYAQKSLAGIWAYQPMQVSVYKNQTPLYEGDLAAVVLANGTHFGGGMHVAPHARLNNGEFTVILVRNVSRLRLVKLLALIYSGKHLEDPNVMCYQASDLEVKTQSTRNIPVESDGESPGFLNLKAQCLKEAIRVLVDIEKFGEKR